MTIISGKKYVYIKKNQKKKNKKKTGGLLNIMKWRWRVAIESLSFPCQLAFSTGRSGLHPEIDTEKRDPI